MSYTAAICTRGLSKDYGSGHGLFDLDLEVERGEIFGRLPAVVGAPVASPVCRELATFRPVLVIHLVDEHLDLFRTDLEGVDERLSDAGDEPALLVEVARRLLHCDDGQAVPPGWLGCRMMPEQPVNRTSG